MRRIALFAAMAALGLAACGGDNQEKPAATQAATETPTQTATETATQAAGTASTLAIAADPSGALKFTKTKLTAKAGRVKVEFSNASQVPHAVAIEGNGVEETGETVTGQDAPPMTVDLPAGTYTFYCPVDGHRAAGMEGTLTVR